MAEPGTITLEFDFMNQRFLDAAEGLKRFAAATQKDFDQLPQVLSKELRAWLDTVAEALSQQHGSPWPGGTTPNSLSVRSGDLIKSIVDSVNVTGSTFGDIQGFIGAGKWGTVHEYGATIHAKNVHFLTIPLPAALDSRGLPLKKSAKEWNNTFVARSKKGNLLIFQKVGTTIIPLYLLRESVTIPPRLGMERTLNSQLPYFVDKVVDAMVKSLVAQKAS